MKSIVLSLVALLFVGCSAAKDVHKKGDGCCPSSIQSHSELTPTAELQSVPQLGPITRGGVAVDDATLIGGGKPGDKGLKPIDPPKFDLPSPFSLTASIITAVVNIVMWVLQLAVVILIAWVVVRAINRKRNTGKIIPAKGEKTLFDIFDSAVAELKARHTDRTKEVAEIEKRLPSNTKAKLKNG